MGRSKRQSRRGRPRGAENKLSRWLDATGMSRDQLAEYLKVDRAHVDKLCRGARRPSLELALAVEKLTRGEVPASTWVSVPKHSHD